MIGQRLAKRILAFNQTDRDIWVERIAGKLPPGSKVLDVGAGTCPYRSLFVGCEYRTQDFAKLDPAQLKESTGYGTIDYVSDIVAIPVPDGEFDVVLCTEVLEHVPDPTSAVREISRVLRPGGFLVLTAPLGSGLHQEPYHYYGGFTPFWYQRFLREAGFENIVVEPNGGFFRFYGQESQRFNVLLHPRNFHSSAKLLAGIAWLVTFPLFRVVLPAVCFALDRFDRDRAFTVGYHVTATRCAAAKEHLSSSRMS